MSTVCENESPLWRIFLNKEKGGSGETCLLDRPMIKCLNLDNYTSPPRLVGCGSGKRDTESHCSYALFEKVPDPYRLLRVHVATISSIA